MWEKDGKLWATSILEIKKGIIDHEYKMEDFDYIKPKEFKLSSICYEFVSVICMF